MLEGAEVKKSVFIQNYVQVMRRCRPYMVQKEVRKQLYSFTLSLFTLITMVLVLVVVTRRWRSWRRSEKNDDDDDVEVTASDHDDRSKELRTRRLVVPFVIN